jgi:type VI secretion system secreted protein Hcp
MKTLRSSSVVRVLAVILALAAVSVLGGVGQPRVQACDVASATGLDINATARPFFDIFAEISGVQGESANPAHKGAIEVLSWSWGVSQVSGADESGSAGQQRTGHITLIKRIDKATPLLFRRCVDDISTPLVTVYLTREDGQTCLKYELKNVMVGSILHNDDVDGDGQADETLELSFTGARLTYTLFDITGKPAGQATAEW